MKSHALAVLLILAITTQSCALTQEVTPIDEYPVAGTVIAGPVCPVAQNPPDPACADRPVASAVIHILDSDRRVYSEIVTDENGRFAVQLPAGFYTLEPQPVDGLIGTAPPQEFEAGAGFTIDLTVLYDTGIR